MADERCDRFPAHKEFDARVAAKLRHAAFGDFDLLRGDRDGGVFLRGDRSYEPARSLVALVSANDVVCLWRECGGLEDRLGGDAGSREHGYGCADHGEVHWALLLSV